MKTWWGYLHVNGVLKVKEYVNAVNLDEANGSKLIVWVSDPFVAENKLHAYKIAKFKLTEFEKGLKNWKKLK